MAEIQGRFDVDLEAIENERRAARDRLAAEAESAIRNARQALDQEVWLADSVVEATKTELQKELAKIRAEAPGRLKSLAAVQASAEKYLDENRMTVPVADESAAPVAEAETDPIGLYRDRKQAARDALARLKLLRSPRLFKGARPHLTVILVGIAVLPDLDGRDRVVCAKI